MGRRRRQAGQGAGTLPEAIAALSRALPAAPSPEVFRRAKFDRPEAAPALWRLLLHLLAPQNTLGAAASLAPEARARSVKSALRSRGYPRPALAQLREDGSLGSRELLLALAWLLAREPLMERLLAQTRVQLGDQAPESEAEALAGPDRVEAEVPVDLRHLQWLMGKLRFRWRRLASGQREQCALLSKIHTYTRGCHSDRNLGHLSVAEVEMLRDPEGGLQLQQALERENSRLQAALEWRRCELVFWQWMDTVLDACPPGGAAAAPQPPVLPGVPEPGLGELELVTQELQSLQEELLEATARRRAAWEAQVGGRGRGPTWSAARRAAREAVRRELAALRRAWEEDGAPSPPRGPHRLVRSEDGAPGARGLRAAAEIGQLRRREAGRGAELRGLRGRCARELARLAGALPGLLWIPPPGGSQ